MFNPYLVLNAENSVSFSKQQLQEAYEAFYPEGDGREYCQYLFNALDTNKNQDINFNEYAQGLSIVHRGKFVERARLGFKVYDFNEHQVYNHQGWLKVLDPKYSVDERLEIIYEMYKDVEIAVAQPIYQYWKEFTIVFPKCKVIFYEREIKSWAKSGFNQLKILSEQNKIPMEISNFYLKLFSGS